MYFHFFGFISIWKKEGILIYANFNPLYFVSGLVEIGPVVVEKMMKLRKVYNNTDNDDNDNDRNDEQRRTFDQKISLEPSAQGSS